MNSPLNFEQPPEVVVDTADCPQHGRFERRSMSYPELPNAIRSPCPACLSERQAKDEAYRKAAEAQQASFRRAQLRELAEIPTRYRETSFCDFVPESKQQQHALNVCKRFAETIETQATKGGSLVLTGGPGTGKTMLACSLANAIIANDLRHCLYTTTTKLVRSIKETYRRDSVKSEGLVMNEYIGAGVLILDEVGVQVGSDHEKLLLFEVLNERYQQLLPTVLISNYAGDELESFLGHRVMDRYRQCGVVLPFDWQSYRGRK